MKENTLYREKAIQYRLNKSFGTVRLHVPVNYCLAGIFSFILLIAILSYVFFASFAEKITLLGYLDSDNGIVTIHAERDGVLAKSLIAEGKTVKKGDHLLLIAHGQQEKMQELTQNLEQRRVNLQKAYQLKNEEYMAITKLHTQHYVSDTLLKNAELALIELSNQIKLIDSELIQHKHNDWQWIKAPVDGVITNIFTKPGQIISPSRPLLQLIPQNTKLIARLYALPQDIGAIKKDAKIALYYDAYPAQRFGSYQAFIREINLTVLTDAEDEKPIKIGQPYYKIKAELATPFIYLNGQTVALNHGMTLHAVVSGLPKKIWQWVLDPIYSYYGDIP